tara:strand:+ start:3893 stop:4228 length:336 start_codon:yes stop_codon:yes gene_type:complete
MSDILIELGRILEQRKQADAAESYVASLHHKGLNKILEKVGEEATETIIAAKDYNSAKPDDSVVKETADLWFHTLVMLSHLELGPEDVLEELRKRFDISGHAEKAARTQTK